MMRAILFAFTLVYFAACSSGMQHEKQQAETIAPSDATIKELHSGKIFDSAPDTLLTKLCRTWYCKSIMLDDLGEEYPTNNEEFLLQQDMRYKAVDRIENDSVGGTWLIENGDLLELTDQSGRTNRFKLTLLTADSLITKVLDMEGENISIHYSRKK